MITENSSGADTAKRNRIALAALLLLVFAIGILTLPASLYTGDPNAWREEARSLVLHGTLHVNPEEETKLNGLGTYFVLNLNGQWYSRYGIFNGLINTIPLAAERLITGELPPLYSPGRVLFLGVFFVAQAMLIAFVLYRITAFYTTSAAARVAYVSLAFYTSYLWHYLRATNSEATQLLLLATAFLFYLRYERQGRALRDLYAGWGFMLLLCLTKLSYLAFLPLYGFACMLLQKGLPRERWGRFFVTGIALPCLIILGLQGLVLDIKFGSPLLSGYHQGHEVPYPHTFWSATADFIWGPQGSVFVHFPLLLLALTGARRFARHHGSETVFLLGTFLITLMLVAPEDSAWRGEWCYGPRYFAPVLPLLALPALYPLEFLFTPGRDSRRMAARAFLCAAALFLVCAQMEVNRLDYHFKYRIFPGSDETSTDVSPGVNAYFKKTNFSQINWDHLQAHGDWQTLPYYAELKEHASPEALEKWKKYLQWEVSRSNIYWFGDAVR